MITFVSRLTWVAVFFLTGCAAIVDQAVPSTDDGPLKQKYRHRLTVTTNIPAIDKLVYLASNYENDVDCVGATAFRWFSLEADAPFIQRLRFRRQAVDDTGGRTALFEWNICLEIDGVIYRAWRGFDPGPDTDLEVACFIDREQISRQEVDIYLCETIKVTQNRNNHSEVAVYCTSYDCTGFDSLSDYTEWAALNPISNDEQFEIAAAVFRVVLSTEYCSSSLPRKYYLKTWAGDPPSHFLEGFSTGDIVMHAGSEFEQDKGMKVDISYFLQIEAGVAKGVLETRCGPMWASGNTVIMEKIDNRWTVKSIVNDWMA